MKHGSSGKGFTAQPSTLESHASRTDQRADDVDSHAQGIGSTSLHGQSLGNVGAGTSSAVNNTVQRASTAVGGMGSKLRNTANTTRGVAGRYRDTEDSNAGLFNPSKFDSGATRGGKTTPQSAGNSTASGSRGGRTTFQDLNGGRPYPGEPPVSVRLDNHQLKHQNGPLFNLDPKNTSNPGAAKFPSNVDESWHEKYFGPRAAKFAQDEIGARMKPINDLRDKANEHDINANNLNEDGKQKVADARAAKRAGNQAESDRLMGEATQMSQQRKAEQEAAAQARRDADNQENQLKATQFSPKKIAQPDDNVKYDISVGYDHDSQSWNAVYHGNPDIDGNAKATENWRKNEGAAIANQYGLQNR